MLSVLMAATLRKEKMTNNEILNDPCPVCGKVGRIHLLQRSQDVKVRGECFNVRATVFHCAACESEFETADGQDALDTAYRAYRDANGLLQPEALKEWRKSLALKQSELASLLGWSPATVSRYENGALQDDAHDRSMRTAMTPDGLAALVAAVRGFPEEKLASLHKSVTKQLGSADQLAAVVCSRMSGTSVPLHWEKLCESVLYFCQGKGVPRTKLNKLLFYVDFLHAKTFGVSVTGIGYVRLPHGPVPDGYQMLFVTLQEERLIDIVEEERGEHVAYVHHALRGPNVGVFSDSEMSALAHVKLELSRATATEISDRSHLEEGWIKTPTGANIPYVYAKSLSMNL